jgi:hypothetical protein
MLPCVAHGNGMEVRRMAKKIADFKGAGFLAFEAVGVSEN